MTFSEVTQLVNEVAGIIEGREKDLVNAMRGAFPQVQGERVSARFAQTKENKVTNRGTVSGSTRFTDAPNWAVSLVVWAGYAQQAKIANLDMPALPSQLENWLVQHGFVAEKPKAKAKS